MDELLLGLFESDEDDIDDDDVDDSLNEKCQYTLLETVINQRPRKSRK